MAQATELPPLDPEALAAARSALPPDEVLDIVIETFAALGDPTCARILYALGRRSLCVRDLALLLAVSESAVSHQVRLLREREGERLDEWIEKATNSGVEDVRRFTLGLKEDDAAVQAGLTLPYSNGQTEGQIHRLKLVRRSMYGRGKFDLLERRVLSAA
jgi:DNA-binding transcriptional ArsR family regulator